MPGQQPSDLAATQSSIRDEVVRHVFGGQTAYSGLSSSNQDDIDSAITDAFYDMTNRMKWYAEVDPAITDLPSEFNELVKVHAVYRGLRRFHPASSQAHAWNTQHVLPLEQRVAEAYADNWLDTTVLQDDTYTPNMLRKAAIAEVVRQRTPIFPPPREVDRIIRNEFVKLWEMRKWEFRKRRVELTIQTDGDVLVNDPYTFDGMVSKKFHIQSSAGVGGDIEWIDASRWAEAEAEQGATPKTGRPRYFYDVDHGAEQKIRFIPEPDKEYTAFAVILIGAPAFGDGESADGIKSLPVAFRTNLYDMVIAKIKRKWGREDGDARAALQDAQRERDSLAAEYDNKGASRSSARSQTDRGWINSLVSGVGISGGH